MCAAPVVFSTSTVVVTRRSNKGLLNRLTPERKQMIEPIARRRAK